MKRKMICKQILMSGVVLSGLTFLLGVPIQAQQTNSGVPPAWKRTGVRV